MTSPTKGEKPKATRSRYQAYFWLMDASLVCGLILLIEILLPEEWFNEVFDWTVGVAVLFFIIVVIPFLIVARFMRDDYADNVWRRTVEILVLVIAAIPTIFLIVTWPMFFLIEPSRSPFYKAYYEFFVLIDTQHPVRGTLMMVWLFFNLTFVVIFQFLRWKDSR